MKRYLIHRSTTPALDWSEAGVLTDFTFAWEHRLPPKTEFRALHDGRYFHFRFDCVDQDLVLPDAPTAKERAIGSDRVEIFFTPDLSLKTYYGLEMTPKGDVLSFRGRFYREMDWSWTCDGLEISPLIEGTHYQVTGHIPLATLGALGVLHGREMFAGLYRAEFHHKPDGSIHSGWMPWINPQTEKPDFHVPSSFGVLELADE